MSRRNRKRVASAEPAVTKSVAASGTAEKRLIVIIVSVFLAAVLLFGAIYGIVIAVINAGYVMTYGGIGVDSGVVAYLTSYYKAVYMKNLAQDGNEVEDTAEFWGQIMVNETTLGDYLKYSTENYIKQVLAVNYLFDRYATLTSDDKKDLELAVREKLDYLAGGSVSTFNEMSAEYGFDYDDFKEGSELLYKAWSAKSKMFGENGEYMLEFPDEVEEYYKSYSHVKLLFVRTESTFVLDENGDRVKGDDGNDTLRDLTDEEKAQRLESVEYLKGVIAKINSGESDGAIFDQLLRDYDEGDRDSHTKGYYFNENASYTKEFADEFKRVVDIAYEIDIGKASYTECSVGYCFIYRIPRETGAYVDTSSDWCFSDFFPNASTEMFQKMIDEIAAEVEVRDGWSLIDPVSIPYTTDFIARF